MAYDTFDPAGQRLLDERMLNGVLVMMLTTAILGPILTQSFAPSMLSDEAAADTAGLAAAGRPWEQWR